MIELIRGQLYKSNSCHCFTGWLYDITQNYNVSVIFAGGIFVLAGLTNFLVLCTKSSRASGENRKNSDNMNRGV